MSFSYDVQSDVGKVRMLIGDTIDLPTTPAQFQDEELQAIVNFTAMQIAGPTQFFGGGSPSPIELLLLSSAQAMESLASRTSIGATGQSLTQGNVKLVGKDQVAAMHAAAQKFRDAVNNLPAWGIIEENLCGFNELVIIRNWILRTEL